MSVENIPIHQQFWFFFFVFFSWQEWAWNKHDTCMNQDRVDVPVIAHSSFTSNTSLQEVRTKW